MDQPALRVLIYDLKRTLNDAQNKKELLLVKHQHLNSPDLEKELLEIEHLIGSLENQIKFLVE
jgi:hypothetical protein